MLEALENCLITNYNSNQFSFFFIITNNEWKNKLDKIVSVESQAMSFIWMNVLGLRRHKRFIKNDFLLSSYGCGIKIWINFLYLHAYILTNCVINHIPLSKRRWFYDRWSMRFPNVFYSCFPPQHLLMCGEWEEKKYMLFVMLYPTQFSLPLISLLYM